MMSNLSDLQKFQIDFNVQDVAVALGMDISMDAGAAILGVSEDDFKSYTDDVNIEVNRVAELLRSSDNAIKALTERLSRFSRILFIGDSITTYRYSYARLIKHLATKSEVINHGYSGYTSNHGLELTHTRFINIQPDLVFIKYGVNDAKRFAGSAGETLVSPSEYQKNLQGIVQAFRKYTNATIVLITPTPVVSDIVDTLEDFQIMKLSWVNDDIRQLSDIVRELSTSQETLFIDLFTPLTDKPDKSFYLPDGLHPNFSGHQEILKIIANNFMKSE